MNRFGYETKASHLLHFSDEMTSPGPKTSSEGAYLKITEVDLHTLESKEYTIPNSKTVLKESQKISHELRDLLSVVRVLIPDTIGFAAILRSFNGINDQGEETTIEQSSRSFAFTHVSHPDAFGAWDYDLNLNFGGGVDLSQRFILDDKAKTKISFSRYSVNALFSATGHTPLGAIGLSLGPSLGLYQLSDPRLDGQTHFTGEMNVEIHYTFFLTEKVMVRIRGNTIKPGGPISRRVFASSRTPL